MKSVNGDIKKDRMLGVVLILVSATGFGLMAVFAKIAYLNKVNTLTILSIRFVLAAVLLWMAVFFAGKDYNLPKKQIFFLSALGMIGYGLMAGFFFNAVKLIPASITGILLYIYPVIVTLLSAWFYKEKITGYKVISLILSLTGLILVVGAAFTGLNTLGVFYGLMSAVSYSAYLLMSNKLVDKLDPMVMAAYITTSAALLFNVIGWGTKTVHLDNSLGGWLAIAGIAIFSTVIALLALFGGLKILGPSKTSIISTIEPVVTLVAAFIILGEKLQMIQLAGSFLVIFAVLLIQKDT
jgi:drug/metabolite transporter (DMT)-like permease